MHGFYQITVKRKVYIGLQMNCEMEAVFRRETAVMERKFNPGDIVRHFKRETLTELELRSNPRKYLYKVLSIDAINTVDEMI